MQKKKVSFKWRKWSSSDKNTSEAPTQKKPRKIPFSTSDDNLDLFKKCDTFTNKVIGDSVCWKSSVFGIYQRWIKWCVSKIIFITGKCYESVRRGKAMGWAAAREGVNQSLFNCSWKMTKSEKELNTNTGEHSWVQITASELQTSWFILKSGNQVWSASEILRESQRHGRWSGSLCRSFHVEVTPHRASAGISKHQAGGSWTFTGVPQQWRSNETVQQFQFSQKAPVTGWKLS